MEFKSLKRPIHNRYNLFGNQQRQRQYNGIVDSPFNMYNVPNVFISTCTNVISMYR